MGKRPTLNVIILS